MPTYEFRCPQGHDFEKFYRTISGAEARAACPQCAQIAERVMSPTGFAFKGSGFYLTDYGKNAHREKGTDAKPGAAERGGDGAKSDAPSASAGDGGASSSSEARSGDGKPPSTRGDAATNTPAKGDGKPAAAKPATPATAAPKKSTE